jgi:hypothetical protein
VQGDFQGIIQAADRSQVHGLALRLGDGMVYNLTLNFSCQIQAGQPLAAHLVSDGMLMPAPDVF